MTWIQPFLIFLSKVFVRLHHFVELSLNTEKRRCLLGSAKLRTVVYLHFLIFAGTLRLIVKKAVGVGRFDHLDQDGSDLALQGQEAFGKGRRRHLNPAFVRRVDL